MDNNYKLKFINLFRDEFRLNSSISNTLLISKLDSSINIINENVGKNINYETDSEARELLKYRMFYDLNLRIAEFNELYGGEYAALQSKYYEDANLS